MITLKTLADATPQQVFDHVAKHLLTQNCKCTMEDDRGGFKCIYKFQGLSCAAGCLISESEYKEEMEGAMWELLIELEYAPSAHMDLIKELQNMHDDTEVEDWKAVLGEIAYMFKLNTNVLN